MPSLIPLTLQFRLIWTAPNQASPKRYYFLDRYTIVYLLRLIIRPFELEMLKHSKTRMAKILKKVPR